VFVSFVFLFLRLALFQFPSMTLSINFAIFSKKFSGAASICSVLIRIFLSCQLAAFDEALLASC
jgi:hypothetical protein